MINHRPPDGWLCTVSEGVEGSHSRSWCRKPGKSSKILALPQILSRVNWAKRVTCCKGQISLRWSGSLHECSLYFRDWHWRWTFAKMSHLTPQWFGQAVVGQAGDVQVFEKQELQWVLWTSSSIMILMIQVKGIILNCLTNSDLLRNFNMYDYHDSILPNWFKISQKLSFPFPLFICKADSAHRLPPSPAHCSVLPTFMWFSEQLAKLDRCQKSAQRNVNLGKCRRP